MYSNNYSFTLYAVLNITDSCNDVKADIYLVVEEFLQMVVARGACHHLQVK